MNINLDGNTLTRGYFGGIVLAPDTGSGARWIVKNSAYATAVGDCIQADTSGRAFTITLPASASSGDRILIQDAKSTWNTNNLTITATGGLKINTTTSNYTASVSGNKLSVVYISTTYGWSIK